MEKPQEENKKLVIKYNENKIELYENNMLVKIMNEVYIGKNGLTNEKKEGDMCTPIGEYKLGFAFGTVENTFTYPYYKINENHYWVDDPESVFYNEWVEVTDTPHEFSLPYMHTTNQIIWNSAEHLIDHPKQYELAFVIEYNINPKEKNRGSAIFFHVKNKDYTAGCIATTLENLLYIIRWLNNDKAMIEIQAAK